MEKITEKEEIEEEKSEVREWTEEDDDEIGNMVDPYYELQKKNSSRQGNLRGGQYHDLAKQLSHYLYFFFFSFSFILDLLHRRECGKVSCHKCHIVTVTSQKVTASCHMTSYDGSHDRHGKVVHRPYSSCISSIENLMETLLSSLCQSLNKEQLA